MEGLRRREGHASYVQITISKCNSLSVSSRIFLLTRPSSALSHRLATVRGVRRFILGLSLMLIVAGCADDLDLVGTSSANTPVTTGPVTASAGTSSPATTSAVTTSPIGDTTLPRAELALSGAPTPVDVLEVFDGDSLEVRDGGRLIEIRLEGINAPERDECFGDTARSGLLTLLDGADVSIIELDRDQFGRTLAYLLADGQVANLAQITAGLAIATSYEHEATNAFLDAEHEAFSRGRGLWASAACGPDTPARIAVARVEANPPGDDADHLNDEWIGFVNDGDTTDISLWVVRDESSTHRFTFPSGTVFEGGEALVVRTGCGSDSTVEFFWCAEGPVWSNSGDMVLLLDPLGNVVDRYRYEG